MSGQFAERDRSRHARVFGGVAGEYERGRPGYPEEAVGWLLGSGPLEVVDVGAGTGKLTRLLVAAGHRVWAVEPDAKMRGVLRDAVPEAQTLDGTGEQIPLPDGGVEAVLAGSAFHWFDHERALAEAARVLRAPGVLGLLGNVLDRSVPWIARVADLLGPTTLERPGHWPARERLGELFESVASREIEHVQRIDRASLRDLAVSRSRVAVLPPSQRLALLADLDRVWEETLDGAPHATLRWKAHVLRCAGPRAAC